MVKAVNVRIIDVLQLLVKLNLSYDFVDITFDEENNRLIIDPITPEKRIETDKVKDISVKDSKITDENINDLI